VELHQNKSRSFFCAQQKYSFLVKLLSLERRFIETSNLLEKGLIQKTVYLVKWNFTKSNCVVFLRSKNNLVSLVKLFPYEMIIANSGPIISFARADYLYAPEWNRKNAPFWEYSHCKWYNIQLSYCILSI
jgi:hypothetical protein